MLNCFIFLTLRLLFLFLLLCFSFFGFLTIVMNCKHLIILDAEPQKLNRHLTCEKHSVLDISRGLLTFSNIFAFPLQYFLREIFNVLIKWVFKHFIHLRIFLVLSKSEHIVDEIDGCLFIQVLYCRFIVAEIFLVLSC